MDTLSEFSLETVLPPMTRTGPVSYPSGRQAPAFMSRGLRPRWAGRVAATRRLEWAAAADFNDATPIQFQRIDDPADPSTLWLRPDLGFRAVSLLPPKFDDMTDDGSIPELLHVFSPRLFRQRYQRSYHLHDGGFATGCVIMLQPGQEWCVPISLDDIDELLFWGVWAESREQLFTADMIYSYEHSFSGPGWSKHGWEALGGASARLGKARADALQTLSRLMITDPLHPRYQVPA